MLLLTKSAVIGISIAAPVGPIGLLCIQRTLVSGVKTGFACGLGAATADAIYGAIGAFGLTAIMHWLTGYTLWLSLAGALFLIIIGWRLMSTPLATQERIDAAPTHSLAAFASTLLLTLANPMTMVSFIAVFSALSGRLVLSAQTAGTMVTGVFIGSVAWWLLLVLGVAMVRQRIKPVVIQRISQSAGVFLLGMGLWQIYDLL